MSSTTAVSFNPSRHSIRSRSSSLTESISPESTSSDSHSSSDPDTHLSSPWLQTPDTAKEKTGFSMDIDTTSNLHVMDLEQDVSFDGEMLDLQALNGFQSCIFNLDDPVLNNTPTNTKSDMIMLEEIIKDGAFDPGSTSIPPSLSHPAHSPAFRDFFISPPSLIQEPLPQPLPHLLCVDPSSTQGQPQIQGNSIPPAPLYEDTGTDFTFRAESAGVLLSSPDEQDVNDPVFKHEPSPVPHPLLPGDSSSSSEAISSNVVYPPKDACLDLPIFFPGFPNTGAKSRVETQIKLAFELGTPVLLPLATLSPESPALGSTLNTSSRPSSSSSSGSSSPSTSATFDSRDAFPTKGSTLRRSTHDKVGTYRFLRLPHGTATKRRPRNLAGPRRESGVSDADADRQDTLDMTAEVVCCSPPRASVESCASCQSREAKRTARKLASRVRPPPHTRSKPKTKNTDKKSGKKVKGQTAEAVDLAPDEGGEEPNVDGSILQFNCAEIVDFSGGSVVLPMRITCYCRHHKEKIGFNIVFTLRDYIGRLVGRGITPPILITDDHKSNNAVSKLPPMHPLRQALNPSTHHAVTNSPSNSIEDLQPPESHHPASRAPTKRCDVHTVVKKRRPKPYDGRPLNRIVAVAPGMEGRQGLVLALHPAHARAQASARSASPSASTDVGASPALIASSSPVTRTSTPLCPEPTLAHPSHSPNSLIAAQSDAFGSEPVVSHPSSSRIARSSPLTLASLPTSLSQSGLRSYPQEQQAIFDASQFPIYSSLSTLPFIPDPPSPPKIHRLIPSSGPTTGGIEITVLGSNFHSSLHLECIFGGAVASSTHRWSDNTLVCVLPPRATPGLVGVDIQGVEDDSGYDKGGTCVFNYVDESDRQLMELALQVVGLKMTGKIEEARNVAMRIVGNTNTQTPTMTPGELTQMNSLSGASFAHHSFLGSLGSMDLETLIIKLLTLLDVPSEESVGPYSSASQTIGLQNVTGQTLLHLAVLLALPALVSCLTGRSIDVDACNNNGLTALHLAALTGWKEGVEILLAAGADVNIVDSMGLTPLQRAMDSRFEDLEVMLKACSPESAYKGESGDDGDDEAWRSDSQVSVDDGSTQPWSTAPPEYMPRSRLASSTCTDSSPDDLSEPEEPQQTPPPPLQAATTEDSPLTHEVVIDEKPAMNEKQDASFVERLQRTLPQGILPNVQIPGLPQLPGVLAAPWGALPQIPVFPVFVPIPNLSNLPNWPTFPWPDALSGEKKKDRADEDATGGKQQQPPLAMLWTAYDNFANSAWRAQWEKWTAQVTALQNASNRGAELPPYTPRSEKQQGPLTKPLVPDQQETSAFDSGVMVAEDAPVGSVSRTPASKATRRVSYGAVRVPEIEVDAYHYRPKKKANQKQDRMLVLFWIPILFLGLAYAIYTTLPVAVAGISRATKRMLHQRDQQTHV